MAERQGSAAPRGAGGRDDRWPLVIERVDEVPPVLAHDLIDAAVAVFTANDDGSGATKTAIALDRLGAVIQRGVRDGVFRWVKADPL